MRAPASLPPPPRWLLALLAAGLAGVALWLRLHRLDAQSFWLDESASMRFASLPPSEIWGADNHPPLYYLLLHYWMDWAGHDGWRLRLLSALFSLAALPAVYLIGRRVGGAWIGLAATLVVACGAFDLRYAQELRMYSLLNCAAAWALAGFAALLADPARAAAPRESRAAWALLGLGTLAALYTHSMAVLLPAVTTLLAAVLWWRRPQRLALARNWVLVHGLVLLAWAPFLPELLRQSGLSSWQWIPLPHLASIAYNQLQLAYGLPNVAGPWQVAALLGFLVLTLLGWRALPAGSPWRVALPVLALFPPLAALAISWTYRPVYLARPLIWTELPMALLVGAGIVAVLSRRPRALGAALLLATAIGNGYSLWHYYKVYGKPDWRSVAATAMTLVEPGETILVPHSDHQAFEYYVERLAETSGTVPPPVLGLWHSAAAQSLALVGFVPQQPRFLLVEVSWLREVPFLTAALRWRFPCHERTRAAERSGMILWRYERDPGCTPKAPGLN